MFAWRRGEYPKWYMAETIAWYRAHEGVKRHAQDAQADKTDQLTRKG